jgi:TRAP-type mannitol/chloroaromatic compound transport system permease small subunit
MDQPSPRLLKTIRVIDRFTEQTGSVVAWLILPMVLGLAYEVIARYVFSAPTIWAFDMTYMLYGTMFMLGAHYALLKGAHIRTDMLYEKYSDRKKGLVDSIAYLLFFFPGMALFFFASVDEAYHAWSIMERSEQTAWRPLLAPFKTVVPLTALLLIIQGVSELLKSLYAARTGVALSKREGIQI